MTSSPSSSTTSPAVAVVCVGMAGSGKTTFMQRINSYLHQHKDPPYVINLDPAVRNVPFEANIDIRDTINYKEVMKQYNLGPNGGILTSLNLFATKIHQVMDLLQKRTTTPPPTATGTPAPKHIHNIIVDTPGQIEVFVWSASGDIILGSLASSFPTVVAYIIDTPRTVSTSTFMSNMLYACSILYKTKLPMILVCNKTDVQDAGFVTEWMTDFEAFQAALRREEEEAEQGGGSSGYMGSLLNSMSLVLEEFYAHLKVVPVSSMTGQGVDEFFDAVKDKTAEFERDYRPELERRREQRGEEKKKQQEKDFSRLMKDMDLTKSRASKRTRAPKEEPETISDLEDGGDDEDDGNGDAGLVEPDDEDDDEDDAKDEGVTKRYKDALKSNADKNPGDDFSFARYVHNANVG